MKWMSGSAAGWPRSSASYWDNLANSASQQGYSAANLMTQLGQQGFNNAQSAGQGIANTNLSAGLNAAQNLPGVATAQQKANQLDSSLLQTVGAAQQQQNQQQRDRVNHSGHGRLGARTDIRGGSRNGSG